MRGTYNAIVRRLNEAEARADAIPAPGCPRCRAWPDCAVFVDDDPPPAERGPWPEPARCPGCGRTPRHVFRIAHVDTAPQPPVLGDLIPGTGGG